MTYCLTSTLPLLPLSESTANRQRTSSHIHFTSTSMAAEIDHTLFPVPTCHVEFNKNLVLPKPRPGVSAFSTQALQEILTDNHKRWHVFFNDKGFHNHTAHAALTLWSLGADAAILKASYAENSSYQRPAFQSTTPITGTNWKDHLGDENYYQGYLHFFESELKTKSFSAILEEYVFSPNANHVKGSENQPEMANRFLEGLLHPMIHTGFGIEFTLPGIFAEGLAQTAVHKKAPNKMIPPQWFSPPSPQGLVSRFAEAVSFTDKKQKPNVHAFTILARVLADTELGGFAQPAPYYNFYPDVVDLYGDKIIKHVDEWNLDGDLHSKLQELLWVNTLLYGVGGSVDKERFNADFFLMHIVTSSLFLSQVFAEVSRPTQVLLLRSYFAACLGWYIGRGRPQLDIAGFFSNPSTLHPSAPGPQPTPHSGANPSPSAPEAITPNSWLPIIQSTIAHPDDHVCKLQRALSEYAAGFGLTPPETFRDTELKDAELIDGTLFIRTAGLTLSVMGWVREGQAPGSWDRRGFYFFNA